jgi:N-acetylglucosaminyldiphosphoundecaprenol N-acetyl-beta-D-mannosaminyltransferase
MSFAYSRVTLLGTPIDNLSMEETLQRIESYIGQGTPHQHIAINVHKVASLHRDTRLREVVEQCDLVSADGQPIVWASRVLGRPLKARITGIDLMAQVVSLAARKNYKVYFLGSHPHVLTKVVEHYQRLYPSLRIVGWSDGYWTPAQESQIVAAIRNAKADILFVAMGSPKKEFFVHKHLRTIHVPFAMGVGGSFDVIAGKTRRAPVWMQRSGLEWFWRLSQEPQRLWRRYFSDGLVFSFLFTREFFFRQAK